MLELKPTYDIPAMMTQIGINLQGDFCFSRSFDRGFIERLMYEGFLVMCDKQGSTHYLLPKLHVERCVMDVKDVKIPKRIRSLAHPFHMSVDRDFEGVIKGCHKQHGPSWLYRPLVDVLRDMHTHVSGRVRVHSIELWHGDALVAGEIGVAVGSCFTSYSGFTTEPSSGTVQCIALGRYLAAMGYQLWDLGMGMEYKFKFGAKNVPRLMFMARMRKSRDVPARPLTSSSFPCNALFPASTDQPYTGLPFVISPKPILLPNPQSKRQRKYRAKQERIAAFKAAKAASKAASGQNNAGVTTKQHQSDARRVKEEGPGVAAQAFLLASSTPPSS